MAVNVKEYRELMARASYTEVKERYELYSDLKSLGVNDIIILGLLEEEIERRQNMRKEVTV
jgi:hypothetical protein